MRRIVKMFERGSVCVCGLLGSGKDVLLGNVVVRRKLPYVSNTCYDDQGLFNEFVYSDFDVGGNTYKNFISGDFLYYEYPFPDGTDLYLADVGVYFPSQYCNELNRDYKNVPVFLALSRHLGHCFVHFNVQNLTRAWDKLREMSDQYIRCLSCHWFFGKIVVQHIYIYERFQSCVDRVPPYRVPQPWFSPERRFQWKMDKQRYDIAHGEIRSRWLIYFNKSTYDTRVFKEMLKNGKKTKKVAAV